MSESNFFYAKKIGARFGWARGVKFYLHAQLNRKASQELYDYVERQLAAGLPPDMGVILMYKVGRPYLRRWLKASDRLKFIEFNYGILSAVLSPRGLGQLLQINPLPYMRMTGKSGREYGVSISRENTREGEIRFCFIDMESNTVLSSLRGTIVPDASGKTSFMIGGIQGPKPPAGHKEIAFATHDLNNLRPKQVVVHAASAFVEWFGAGSMNAPAKTNHVAYYWWRNIFVTRKLHTNLDEFWDEFSTERDAHKDYIITVPLRRRTLAEVPSKRRKDWTQRYARIDALATATGAWLVTLTDALEKISN